MQRALPLWPIFSCPYGGPSPYVHAGSRQTAPDTSG